MSSPPVSLRPVTSVEHSFDTRPPFTIAALCERYKCTRKQLWEQRKSGEFPAGILISRGKLIWTADMVDSFEASRPRVAVLEAPPGRLNKAGRPAGLPARAKYAAKQLKPKPAQKNRGRPKKVSHVERARREARTAKRRG
jgi:hypothetical protein